MEKQKPLHPTDQKIATALNLFSIEKLTRLESDMKKKVLDRIGSLKEKGIISLAGFTGVGKSTLANYLFYPENLVVMNRDNMAKCTPEEQKQMKLQGFLMKPSKEVAMGHTLTSATLVPNIKLSNNEHVAYIDLAGFGDTRGIEEQICVDSILSVILEQLEIKCLILVVTYNDLSERANMEKCIQIYDTIKLLGIEKSVLLLISRAPFQYEGDMYPETYDELCQDILPSLKNLWDTAINSQGDQKVNKEYSDALIFLKPYLDKALLVTYNSRYCSQFRDKLVKTCETYPYAKPNKKFSLSKKTIEEMEKLFNSLNRAVVEIKNEWTNYVNNLTNLENHIQRLTKEVIDKQNNKNQYSSSPAPDTTLISQKETEVIQLTTDDIHLTSNINKLDTDLSDIKQKKESHYATGRTEIMLHDTRERVWKEYTYTWDKPYQTYSHRSPNSDNYTTTTVKIDPSAGLCLKITNKNIMTHATVEIEVKGLRSMTDEWKNSLRDYELKQESIFKQRNKVREEKEMMEAKCKRVKIELEEFKNDRKKAMDVKEQLTRLENEITNLQNDLKARQKEHTDCVNVVKRAQFDFYPQIVQIHKSQLLTCSSPAYMDFCSHMDQLMKDYAFATARVK